MGGQVETKKCTKCGEERSLCDFHTKYDNRRNNAYDSKVCRICVNEQARKSCVRCQRTKILSLHGITEVDFEIMFKEQNGVCAICCQPEIAKFNGKIQHLAVDHDHVTGIVRGLLCLNCNHVLGKAKDNPEILRKAADYLEKT